MSKLTIKQFVPIPAGFYVLVPHKEDGREVWRDYTREGMNYFWTLVDGGEEDDYIQLVSADVDGCNMTEVLDGVVAPRGRCPDCGADVTPEVTPYEKSFLRYICPHCGLGLPVKPLY